MRVLFCLFFSGFDCGHNYHGKPTFWIGLSKFKLRSAASFQGAISPPAIPSLRPHFFPPGPMKMYQKTTVKWHKCTPVAESQIAEAFANSKFVSGSSGETRCDALALGIPMPFSTCVCLLFLLSAIYSFFLTTTKKSSSVVPMGAVRRDIIVASCRVGKPSAAI